ncbi:MAG: glycosyltransferase [Candidatus Diapherotrites archaeon]|nr:glycosyltransferase [Candidatus Diapherotrites archaeon]
MKILFATPYAEPERGACVLRMNSFNDYFKSKGHEALFLAPERGNAKNAENILRYKGIRGLLKIVLSRDFDVLVGTSPPMTHSFFALLAAKLRGKPVVLDVRDPWTYESERLGVYSKKSLKLRAYKLIEKISYRLADKIFVVTGFSENILVSSGAKKEKIVLVPNGTIPMIFRRDEAEGTAARKKLGIPKTSVVLLYAGSFVKKDLDKAINALSAGIRELDVFLLLLLCCEESQSGEFGKIRALVQKEKIGRKTKIIDMAGIAYSENCGYFSAADIGLNQVPDAMDYCIPAKTYDYLSAGLPLLSKGPEKSALGEFIKKEKAGFYFTSWEELENEFPGIAKGQAKLASMKKEWVKKAPEKFDRAISGEIALREMKKLQAKLH